MVLLTLYACAVRRVNSACARTVYISSLLKSFRHLQAMTREKLDCSSVSDSWRAFTVSGGAREDRTPDLLRARQALSQLSYGPMCGGSGRTRTSDLTLIRGAL